MAVTEIMSRTERRGPGPDRANTAGFFSTVVLLFLLALFACGGERPMRLATTTSVDHSGLLQELLAAYERESGTEIEALAVGSGQAMSLVRRGDADVMITHEPEGERRFIDEEDPALYRKVMCSDFLLLGPSDDPANIRERSDLHSVLSAIAGNDAWFVSRGDDSGTHVREAHLWEMAGVKPDPARLLETGQGMGPTLRVASEREAYTLADRATWLKLRNSLDLEVMFDDRSRELLNCYAVTVPRGPRGEEALRFAEWLTRGGGRDVIESFRIEGEASFRAWPRDVADDLPEALPR